MGIAHEVAAAVPYLSLGVARRLMISVPLLRESLPVQKARGYVSRLGSVAMLTIETQEQA